MKSTPHSNILNYVIFYHLNYQDVVWVSNTLSQMRSTPQSNIRNYIIYNYLNLKPVTKCRQAVVKAMEYSSLVTRDEPVTRLSPPRMSVSMLSRLCWLSNITPPIYEVNTSK